MIHTVVRPLADRYFAYVYDGNRYLIHGPTRDTPEEAESEALRYYRERPQPGKPLPAVPQTMYHTDNEVRTVSSMIGGRSAAAYWGGIRD